MKKKKIYTVLVPPMPAVTPRRPYDEEEPDGYRESLNDWVGQNQEAVEWFLTHAETIAHLLTDLATVQAEREEMRLEIATLKAERERNIHHFPTIAHLLTNLAAVQAERNAWMDTAAQQSRNAEFYRGLLDQCAEHLGPDVFIADDGSQSEDPLRLKIPDLVSQLKTDRNGWGDTANQFSQELKEAQRDMRALTAERDACRNALQMLADGCSSPGYPTTVTHVPQHHHLMAARATLAQGQKSKEGK